LGNSLFSSYNCKNRSVLVSKGNLNHEDAFK
jgi:hypothetical protein